MPASNQRWALPPVPARAWHIYLNTAVVHSFCLCAVLHKQGFVKCVTGFAPVGPMLNQKVFVKCVTRLATV